MKNYTDILVIDDEEVILSAISKIAHFEGYSTDLYLSVTDAIENINKISYIFYLKKIFLMMTEYCSSSEILANWFLTSRNNWKEKALNKQKLLRKAGIKIRDLQKSREKWKAQAKEYKARIKQLEEEKILQQKKGIYQERVKLRSCTYPQIDW